MHHAGGHLAWSMETVNGKPCLRMNDAETGKEMLCFFVEDGRVHRLAADEDGATLRDLTVMPPRASVGELKTLGPTLWEKATANAQSGSSSEEGKFSR